MFRVRGQFGAKTVEKRAAEIVERIEKLARNALTKIEDVRPVERKQTTDIVCGDAFLVSVTEADAKPTGRTRAQLAADYARQIRLALHHELKSTSAKNIALGALYSLLSLLGLYLLLRFKGRFFRWLYGKIRSWQGTRLRALRIQSAELLSAERVTESVVGVTRAVRVALVLILFYFWIPLVLSFFPWTKGFADKLFGYVSSALGSAWHGFVNYLPNLFYLAVIGALTFYFMKFVKFFAKEIDKGTILLPHFHADWAMPTYKIARFLIFALAAVLMFPYLPGSKSPAFQGVSIFVGVLFSLGSSSAISNVVAGIVLTYMRPFVEGDRVKIADTVGDIIKKDILVTRVRTIKNVDITIPNSMVLGSHIVNYSSSAQKRGLILHTTVTIGYDVPWRQTEALLIAGAKATPGVLAEPEPFVLQTSLDDYYVSYELNAFTDQPNRMAVVYAELHRNVQDKFWEAGVEIMSPHYFAVRDGNQVTIPPENLPKTYESPSFRVEATGPLGKVLTTLAGRNGNKGPAPEKAGA